MECANDNRGTFHHLLLTLDLCRSPSQALCRKLQTEVLKSQEIVFCVEAEVCDHIQEHWARDFGGKVAAFLLVGLMGFAFFFS